MGNPVVQIGTQQSFAHAYHVTTNLLNCVEDMTTLLVSMRDAVGSPGLWHSLDKAIHFGCRQLVSLQQFSELSTMTYWKKRQCHLIALSQQSTEIVENVERFCYNQN